MAVVARCCRLTGDDPGDLPAPPADQTTRERSWDRASAPPRGVTGEGTVPPGDPRAQGFGPGGDSRGLARGRSHSREAWLDAPDEVPGELDSYAGGRVRATASASAGLLAVGRDPGPRAMDLLRGEADTEGRFTGGAYPTFAAAAAYWLAEGPKTEMAEWALRWAREWEAEWWGPWERATALPSGARPGVPVEHPTMDEFLDELREDAPPTGWSDLGLTCGPWS